MKNIFIADDTFEHYGRESAQQSLPAEVVSEYIDQVAYPHVTNPYLYHRFANSDEPAAQEYLNKKYCPDCTLAILDAFNEGALIVQYIGHGETRSGRMNESFMAQTVPTAMYWN